MLKGVLRVVTEDEERRHIEIEVQTELDTSGLVDSHWVARAIAEKGSKLIGASCKGKTESDAVLKAVFELGRRYDEQ